MRILSSLGISLANPNWMHRLIIDLAPVPDLRPPLDLRVWPASFFKAVRTAVLVVDAK